jgi:two-component system response regulator
MGTETGVEGRRTDETRQSRSHPVSPIKTVLSLTQESMRRKLLSICCRASSALRRFLFFAEMIVVVHDGVEALASFLGMGAYAQQRDLRVILPVILLDLKAPKIDALEVPRRLRANEQTRPLPVVILTSLNENQDRINSYGLGANSYVRKPVGVAQGEAIRQLGLYWLILNVPLPAIRRVA